MSGQLQGIRTAAALVVFAGAVSVTSLGLSQMADHARAIGSHQSGPNAGSYLANPAHPLPLDGNDECSDHDHDHGSHDHDHGHKDC